MTDRNFSHALLVTLVAFGASGCTELHLDGKIDRPFLLKKSSGQISRFEKGPIRVEFEADEDQTTRITLSQPGVSESTIVDVPYKKFDSDRFFFDEKQTGSGIAIRGERRHESFKRTVKEKRGCVCPVEMTISKQVRAQTGPNSYKAAWVESDTQELLLKGSYQVVDPDAQFVRTFYTIDLLSRGTVRTRFTAERETLHEMDAEKVPCGIITPRTTEWTKSNWLGTTQMRKSYSKTLTDRCVFY